MFSAKDLVPVCFNKSFGRILYWPEIVRMNRLKFKDVEMRLCFSLAFYLAYAKYVVIHCFIKPQKDKIRNLDSDK